MSSILVFVEQRDGDIKKIALENLSLGAQLAEQTGDNLVAVLIGSGVSSLTDTVAGYGAAKIVVCDDEKLKQYNSEQYSVVLAEAARREDAGVVLLGATAMGKDLGPRLAVLLDACLATDSISVEAADGGLKIVRPMYAGKVRAAIQLKSAVKIITVRPNVYLAEENPKEAAVENLSVDIPEPKATVTEIVAGSGDKLDVTEADIIVSGGRGLKGPENFHLISDLAAKLGAAQGASRAVVDAGWRPYEEQVGQTGKTVSPSLYIAVAISGAIQHLAGMSSSKYIVAINKDPEAPIFKVADYGIVGDAFEVVPKMLEEL